MRNRWIAPSALALLSLALVLLWSRMSSQALVPAGVSAAPAEAGQTVLEGTLDSIASRERRLTVAGDVSLEKTTTSPRVLPGGVATYTLAFSNISTETKSLDIVYDMLPPGVTFKRMITSTSVVTANPAGTTGTIVWADDPSLIAIPAESGVVIEYEVTMPLVSSTVTLRNEAWGFVEGGMVGPGSIDVLVGQSGTLYFPVIARNYAAPRFTVSKTAYPNSVFDNVAEAVFTYTVVFRNEGTVPGVLDEIRDTLPTHPTQFRFDAMVDVDGCNGLTGPVGTTGEIVWTGPCTVAGQSSLTLVYRVASDPVIGTYVNSATATPAQGKGRAPEAPAQATVHIVEPIYLQEDWQVPSQHWAPYLKHSQLHPDQWFRTPTEGWNGSAALVHTYRAGGKEALDALYTYLGPGTDEWGNYRYEAKVKTTQGEMAGLWFRGRIEEPDWETRHVEGYYFVMRARGDDSFVKLGAIRTDDPPTDYPFEFDNVREIASKGDLALYSDEWYTLAVEVEGSTIKCFIDGNLLIEATDSTYSSGTVGMKTYRIKGGLWDNILVTPLPHQ